MAIIQRSKFMITSPQHSPITRAVVIDVCSATLAVNTTDTVANAVVVNTVPPRPTSQGRSRGHAARMIGSAPDSHCMSRLMLRTTGGPGLPGAARVVGTAGAAEANSMSGDSTTSVVGVTSEIGAGPAATIGVVLAGRPLCMSAATRAHAFAHRERSSGGTAQTSRNVSKNPLVGSRLPVSASEILLRVSHRSVRPASRCAVTQRSNSR